MKQATGAEKQGPGMLAELIAFRPCMPPESFSRLLEIGAKVDKELQKAKSEKESYKAQLKAEKQARAKAEKEKADADAFYKRELVQKLAEIHKDISERNQRGKDYAARVAVFREFDRRLKEEGGKQSKIAGGLLDERPLVGAGGKRLGSGAFLNEWRKWCKWGKPDAEGYGARLAACRRRHKGA